MKHFVKERFKESFNKLYDNNYFKNKKSFALSMQITPQFLSQLLNDNTPVPLEFIANYIEVYPINPGFLFNRNDTTIFRSDAAHLKNANNNNTISPYTSSGIEVNSSIEVDDLATLLYKVSQMQLEVARLFEKATANIASR